MTKQEKANGGFEVGQLVRKIGGNRKTVYMVTARTVHPKAGVMKCDVVKVKDDVYDDENIVRGDILVDVNMSDFCSYKGEFMMYSE